MPIRFSCQYCNTVMKVPALSELMSNFTSSGVKATKQRVLIEPIVSV